MSPSQKMYLNVLTQCWKTYPGGAVKSM